MKFIHEVSGSKRRGGFYTPPPLVQHCLSRLAEKFPVGEVHILEPSAGDGAFVVGASLLGEEFCQRVRFTCIERDPAEAAKCAAMLQRHRVQGEATAASFFAWARQNEQRFHAVVGNPPFVRYQYVPPDQRLDAEHLVGRHGGRLGGVSNLWIPFALVTLGLLQEGGVWSLVLPGELFSIKSAGLVRAELIRRLTDLRIELFSRGMFAGIMQDVVVVSGVRATHSASRRPVQFIEHASGGKCSWSHEIPDTAASWTRYLLTDRELAAYLGARHTPHVRALGDAATLGVSIVTGANDFFTVDSATVRRHQLEDWARPLLARSSDCRGLVFNVADHAAAEAQGRRAWMLDFALAARDPLASPEAAAYLKLGEEQGLPSRYKCTIRQPWHRVPDVRHGRLMLSKRAHQFHRLLLNDMQVLTTDTIYRGEMKPGYEGREESLVAAFHNSLTILSSEIEGRTYGGGVLELIPSEVRRLAAPIVEMRDCLAPLDKLCRDVGGQADASDALVTRTDELLCERAPELTEFMDDLRAARMHLRRLRFFGRGKADEKEGEAGGTTEPS